MKKNILITLLVLIALSAIFIITKSNEPSAKIIENFEETIISTWAYTTSISNDSTILWDVKKVWWSHNWKIKIKTWFAIVEKDAIIWWEIILNMNTISVDDIQDLETNKSLVEHLKSEDFFDTKNYQTSTFKILEINETNLIGELVIKDFKNTIEIPVTVKKTQNWQTIISNFSIDRTMRDIMYWSNNLASTLKDKAIDNLINLQLEIKIK